MTPEKGWTMATAAAVAGRFDGEDHDEETLLSAWQHLVDTGLAWTLEGWFGRTAARMIEEGLIHA